MGYLGGKMTQSNESSLLTKTCAFLMPVEAFEHTVDDDDNFCLLSKKSFRIGNTSIEKS